MNRNDDDVPLEDNSEESEEKVVNEDEFFGHAC